MGLTFIDYDHDGDLDLYVTSYRSMRSVRPGTRHRRCRVVWLFRANVMWRNNGNGTFTDVTHSVEPRGVSSQHRAVGTDYNNDRAIDLVVTRLKLSPVRSLKIRGRESFVREVVGRVSGSAGTALAMSVLDFDHDGWMDLAFTHWAAPGVHALAK